MTQVLPGMGPDTPKPPSPEDLARLHNAAARNVAYHALGAAEGVLRAIQDLRALVDDANFNTQRQAVHEAACYLYSAAGKLLADHPPWKSAVGEPPVPAGGRPPQVATAPSEAYPRLDAFPGFELNAPEDS